MRHARVVGLLAGTAAIALTVLTVAAPASAATLPAGQKITVVDALDDAGPQEGPFYDVNPADAAATPVGTGSGLYMYGIDVNDDGLGYAIGGFAGPTLYKADANTGTVSDPLPLFLASEQMLYNCQDLDLNPVTGALLIVCVWFSNETGNTGFVGSVDTTTGLVTPLVSRPDPGSIFFDALATDPVTGTIWAFAYDEGYGSYLIDLDGGTATFTAPVDDIVNGADFDRDGQLFVTSVDEEGDPSLAVVDPEVGTFTSNQLLVSTATGDAMTDVFAITVWGKQALPATGPAEIVPIGLGTALLFLAGAALIATHRISASLDRRGRAA